MNYTVPKFRIEYTEEYAKDTFYVVDMEEGICYQSKFPSAEDIPFPVLDDAVSFTPPE
jgi:hypothetical protein